MCYQEGNEAWGIQGGGGYGSWQGNVEGMERPTMLGLIGSEVKGKEI